MFNFSNQFIAKHACAHNQHIHYKIKSLTYNTLQTSQISYMYIRQLFTITWVYLLVIISSLSQPPIWSSLKFCYCFLVYAAPTLWSGPPKRPPSVCSSFSLGSQFNHSTASTSFAIHSTND